MEKDDRFYSYHSGQKEIVIGSNRYGSSHRGTIIVS
jgi:hypothetical protein